MEGRRGSRFGLDSLHRSSIAVDISGPASFDTLLRSLSRDQPLSGAVEEAERAARHLHNFSADQAMAVWNAGNYLADVSNPPDAKKAASNLLEAVSGRQDLPLSARQTLFHYLSHPSTPDLIPSRVKALIALTDHGRKIDFSDSSVLPAAVSWVIPFYDTIASLRARNKKLGRPYNSSTMEEVAFTDLFQLIIDILTLQRQIPETGDIQSLLEGLFVVCKSTHVTGDIKQALAVFDAIISSLEIPTSTFSSLLEVLSNIHASIKSLAGPTSRVVRNLAKSRNQQEMVELLYAFLLETPVSSDRNLNVTRGAVDIFRDLVAAYGQEGMPSLSFDLLVNSLLQATGKNDGRIDTDILEVCLNMLQGDYLAIALQHNWMQFVEVILTCSRRVINPRPQSTDAASLPKSITSDDIKSNISAHVTRIATSMETAWSNLGEHQKLDVLHFYMSVHKHLTPTQLELALNFLNTQGLCHVESADWVSRCWELVYNFILSQEKPSEIRSLALLVFEESYQQSGAAPMFNAEGFTDALCHKFEDESSASFLEKLVPFLVTIALDCESQTFARLVETISLSMRADENKEDLSPTSVSSHPVSQSIPFTNVLSPSLSNIACVGLVRIFLRALVDHPSINLSLVFEKLIDIARSPQRPSDARLTALKLLFGIRCDSAGSILVYQPNDSNFLIPVISRTIDATSRPSVAEELPNDRKATNDSQSSRLSLKDPLSGPLVPESSRGANDTRLLKWNSPVWTGDEAKAFPENTPCAPSTHIFAFSAELENTEGDQHQRTVLPINFWVETVITLLQREKNWDIYSYVLTHMGSQLMNRELFRNSILQIKLLRSVLCEQIKNETFQEPLGWTGVKKGDIAVCIFAALTNLVSFHQHFAKSEQDEIVRTLMLGIGSWEATSRGCIHALSVCCHEIPMSVTKSLHGILDKMSKVMTRTHIAVHILEFLALLARLPDVYVNLRDEEIRTIFGICLRYIESSREQRYKAIDPMANRSTSLPIRLGSGSKEYSANPSTIAGDTKISDDLSRYVYHLTYHVMVFWFLSLKIQDRSNHISWVTKRLVFTDESGKEVIEEQSQVFMDFMQRVTFSDLGDTIPFEHFPPSESDGPVSKKTWIVGMSILTVETAGASGLSQVTKRQASGTTYASYQQRTAPVLPHQIPVSPSPHSITDEQPTRILPSHILIQLTTSAFPTPVVTQPLPLPDDDFTRRAISTFDRNDIVDGHKIGVIYVGEGQIEEKQILANTKGSADYEFFLSGLGTKVSLENAKFNTQGLRWGDDGEYTYAWRDRVSEIVYHVSTMMPTDLGADPQCVKKKMHIGNDFVNIIFNHSNKDVAFDTILTQFNFVNIVIAPACRVSPIESPMDSIEDFYQTFYTVKVASKPGFPDLSSAAIPKVISGRNLASFVRLIALNASAFSLVSSRGGEHVSSWQNRLREIRRLRERAYAASVGSSDAAAEAIYYPHRRNTKPATVQAEEYMPAQGFRANFGTARNLYTDNNVFQNLDFSRWSNNRG
ncbi:Tuberous sclerosis 2-like protein [Ophidiomyces ophidiicola]|uniref:Tuberous sclerosis 2-like protein n=1 Tax=Ophidiomyces ophidiicola TaxID=1387563 RepID=A0ACB8V4A7_9EURO|nr:Tuberous sclerosis 2-like protein [Ophidiomyces ophidiicola]KAI1914045.1 Tuberous sclerosis 2-like protein [Ophidiomyces ophidiicola]KAI1929547.1 Tuberous sclerosis 2-like protein [Ophidiomyces ophidiicola]KAI1943401.1 Tuberous sclerosis 2-like protein [Ophidiomyces ophidiicola]KAI1951190.1 Tuberous sclerosis 2-like protein [Ophidiomyces ophidiicola]KAI1968425.1 Tuberous sclerosis 2-like protein [Ophidiomyces ophidiicola]